MFRNSHHGENYILHAEKLTQILNYHGVNYNISIHGNIIENTLLILKLQFSEAKTISRPFLY